MSNLRQARRRIYVILGVLLAVDLAAAIVLVTPIAGSGAARQEEFTAVRRQLKQKMQLVIPPDQVQSRVDQARTQIDVFYKDRLAAGASALSGELGKLAAASGVRLNSVHYVAQDSDLPGLVNVHMDASISGDYVADVKFINAVERDQMFFIVDQVNLGEHQGGTVRLAVGLATYVKGAAE
jgi:type IV pilus assembly protein PilO